jgi:hypothetical protein
MAGESNTLKSALLSAYNAQINGTTAQPSPITQLSTDDATAIIAAINSAINGTQVVFVLAAPNGAVTGTITLQSQAT